ncbi:MAG: hypothetical protein QME32_08405 [Endomicrobiia bacterium]|nr:hypothetical protein [Endomicrobiia bacterium]
MTIKTLSIAKLSLLILASQLLLPSGARTSSFIKLPVSAKSVSLGGGFVAGDNLGVVEQNPSALLSLRGLSAEFSQVTYFEGIGLTGFYGGYSGRAAAMALGFKNYATRDTARDFLGAETGKISHSESVVTGAFSTRINKNLTAGIGFKSYSASIADDSAGGLSTSASGMLFDAGFTHYRQSDVYAFSVTNLGSVKYDYAGATEQRMPLTYAAGARHTVGNFVGLWQISKSDDVRRMKLAIGVDYDIAEYFALRMGMNYIQYFDLTFGAGFKFGKFYLDYALSPHMDFGSVHNVSLGVRF